MVINNHSKKENSNQLNNITCGQMEKFLSNQPAVDKHMRLIMNGILRVNIINETEQDLRMITQYAVNPISRYKSHVLKGTATSLQRIIVCVK